MKIATKTQMDALVKNRSVPWQERKPLIKLFGGCAATWLVSEYDPETGCFFGLADLGFGSPELGDFSKEELEGVRFPPFNLPIERDLAFKPKMTLDAYADLAREDGYINA
ncbi:MAG: DUF2958 domain-containing protein [Methylococcales bacterium]|nr:DUF2958 domain-containing protein [Methylococcales bacterium]